MKSADGVASDVVDIERSHWRGALFGVGLVIGAGLMVLFAPQSAHADDGSPGLLGGVLDDVVTSATSVIDPVVAPLPDARQLPLVGGIVGRVVDSTPVSSIASPVAELLDGTLGGTVSSLPVVGGLLGDTPVGDVTTPIAGAVDGVLGEVAGVGTVPPVGPATPIETEDGETGLVAPAVSPDGAVAFAGVARALAPLSTVLSVGEFGVVAPTGTGGSDGPVSVPGGLAPTSAVTSSGSPVGMAAAVLGAGLLLLLARGRLRPTAFPTPPSPIYGTDTSPD